MKNYLIDKEFAIVAQKDSSYGSQPKFYKDGYWYKYDRMGHEGLAEQLVSDLLSCSTIDDYVYYEQCQINGKNGCKSKNMLKDNESLVTFHSAYLNITGRILSDDIFRVDASERFSFLVDFFKKEIDLDCSRYLFDILTLDMLIRNPDRHFKNLSFIMDKDGFFRCAPIFDNGQGLLQNFTISPPYMELEEKEACIAPCTIAGNFDTQFMLAQKTTRYTPFKIDYNKLNNIISYYPDSIAKNYLCYSLNRYKNIFEHNPSREYDTER